MEELVQFTFPLTVLLANFISVQGQEFCDGKTFWCDKGHCCGKGKCCAYYYELWWFWLIWALIILLSCCCLYQQKRFRHRRQTSRRGSRGRPRNRSRIAQAFDAAFITVTPIFDPDRVRLPTYDEAKDMPKDPPPYNALFETRLPETSVAGQPSSHDAPPRHINSAPQASLIDNEEPSDVSGNVDPWRDPPSDIAVNMDSWRDPPPPYTPSSSQSALTPHLTSPTSCHSPIPAGTSTPKSPCTPTQTSIPYPVPIPHPTHTSVPLPSLTLPLSRDGASLHVSTPGTPTATLPTYSPTASATTNHPPFSHVQSTSPQQHISTATHPCLTSASTTRSGPDPNQTSHDTTSS